MYKETRSIRFQTCGTPYISRTCKTGHVVSQMCDRRSVSDIFRYLRLINLGFTIFMCTKPREMGDYVTMRTFNCLNSAHAWLYIYSYTH